MGQYQRRTRQKKKHNNKEVSQWLFSGKCFIHR
jgi:hypothetical protein